MFSQIKNDMNELMDFELDKTSAVMFFAGLYGLAYALGGWIGVFALIATELYRYWSDCNG